MSLAAKLRASHVLCPPKLTAFQPENWQPLPQLPRESCFVCLEEDVTLQGGGYGRTAPDLISVPTALHETEPRCKAWRQDSDTTEGWSHPHSTQGVDPGSAASPLPPVPGTLHTHEPRTPLSPVPGTPYIHTAHCTAATRTAQDTTDTRNTTHMEPRTLQSPVLGTLHMHITPGHCTCRAPKATSTVPQKTLGQTSN